MRELRLGLSLPAIADVLAGTQDVGDALRTHLALARRHVEWLGTVPGTGSTGPAEEYVLGLAEMYVSDPRFSATYGGEEKATFVRDALTVYADRHL